MLRDNEIYVKLEKCSFTQDKVKFLGHKIKDGGLMMDGAKVKAIQDWETPAKVTEVRSFLGLVNYYLRFIKGYSAKAPPLMDLLKKTKAWELDARCQKAGVETAGCDQAVRVRHGCFRFCHWRSSNARRTFDSVREPKAERHGKEVHGVRE